MGLKRSKGGVGGGSGELGGWEREVLLSRPVWSSEWPGLWQRSDGKTGQMVRFVLIQTEDSGGGRSCSSKLFALSQPETLHLFRFGPLPTHSIPSYPIA